jgi:hypothetical protein
MGRFYNNRGMSVNILTAMNTGNNRRTAVSVRRPVNSHPPPLRRWQQYRGNCVFYAVCAKQTHRIIGQLLPGNEAVNTSLTKEDIVFRGVRAEELSWSQLALRVSQYSVGDGHRKFAVEEELMSACEVLTCDLKTLCVM